MKNILVLLAVLTVLASSSFAQGLGFKGIGCGAGYTSVSVSGSDGSETLPGFAFSAHVNLGNIIDNLSIYPEVQYFTTSKDFTDPSVPNTTATWKLNDFAININAHYDFPTGGSVAPYIGAGVGYNMLSTDFTITGDYISGSVSGTDSKFGINLEAGANFNVGSSVMIFVEPRYVLLSDLNHLIVKAGVTYSL